MTGTTNTVHIKEEDLRIWDVGGSEDKPDLRSTEDLLKRFTRGEFPITPQALYEGDILSEGDIEFEGGMGIVHVRGNISAGGSIRTGVGTGIIADGDMNAGGHIITNLDAQSLGSINARGSIISEMGNVVAANDISAAEAIDANGLLAARGTINAGTSIKGRDGIQASWINAGGEVSSTGRIKSLRKR